MKTIWKFTTPLIPGRFELKLPTRSKILSFGNQGNPTFWVLCDPKEKQYTFKFLIAWTGQDFETKPGEKLNFIGTTQVGPIVFHLFQIKGGR